MIADLLPLLAFTAIVVIARNVFEGYIVEHARRHATARESVRVHADAHRAPRVRGRLKTHHR